MTNETQQSRRAAFEAAYIAYAKTGYLAPMIERGMSEESAEIIVRNIALSVDENGEYKASDPREKFLGFCMALDTTVVALPADRSLSASDDPWYVVEQCRHSIHAAGVKTR